MPASGVYPNKATTAWVGNRLSVTLVGVAVVADHGRFQARRGPMATSFYELSVPTFLQTVPAVGGFLDRAVRHCADPDDFVSVRLYDDMAPFHFGLCG